MSSIKQRIATLRNQINQIRNTGMVAPANIWISPMTARNRPGGKIYHYFKLMSATNKRSRSGKIQGKQIEYLGKNTNHKYRSWKAAIARRNQIQKLESIIKKLEHLVSVGSNKKIIPTLTVERKGRKKLSYSSSVVRIPNPLLTQVREIITQFRHQVRNSSQLIASGVRTG